MSKKKVKKSGKKREVRSEKRKMKGDSKAIVKLKKENQILKKMLKKAEKQIILLGKKQKAEVKAKKRKAEKGEKKEVKKEKVVITTKGPTKSLKTKAVSKPKTSPPKIDIEVEVVKKVKCAGKNKDGSPCQRSTTDPSGLCHQHQKK